MKIRNRTNRIVAALLFVAMAWVASGYRIHPDGETMGQFTDIVDRHIPFNVSVVSQPGSYCDLLEVEVLVIQNITGEDLEYRWRVMDGELVQLECNDFYDLYYRCDVPRCLDLRVMTQDYAGRTLSECLGHVCIQ